MYVNIYIHPSNVQEGQDAIHCRVCKLDHHPQLSAKSYVIGETLSIPVCCIEAVLDVQAQALHVLKCHEGHFVQLTENVSFLIVIQVLLFFLLGIYQFIFTTSYEDKVNAVGRNSCCHGSYHFIHG